MALALQLPTMQAFGLFRATDLWPEEKVSTPSWAAMTQETVGGSHGFSESPFPHTEKKELKWDQP